MTEKCDAQRRAVFDDMTPDRWAAYHEQRMRQLYELNMADAEYRRLFSDQNISYRLSGLPSPLSDDPRIFGEVRFCFDKLNMSEQDRRELTLRIHCAMRSTGCVAHTTYQTDAAAWRSGWLFLHSGTVEIATAYQIDTLPWLPDAWELAAEFTPPGGAGAAQ